MVLQEYCSKIKMIEEGAETKVEAPSFCSVKKQKSPCALLLSLIQ